MTPNENKEVVRRFNQEVIQNGSEVEFRRLMAPDFVNRSAPPGRPNGADSMWQTFESVLRPALSELSVDILDQIAEGDKVTTRKVIRGIHTGTLQGVPASGKRVSIEIIDIVRVAEGRYAEHWGINNLAAVLETLKPE